MSILVSRRTSNQSTLMFFVLGLILFILGFSSMTITSEETRYRDVLGFQVPYKVTVYPFQPIGVLMILASIILVAVTIRRTRRKEGSDGGWETLETRWVCSNCGNRIRQTRERPYKYYCPACGIDTTVSAWLISYQMPCAGWVKSGF